MKLRQVALVASNLAHAREQFFRLLGLDDDYADEGLGFFGLNNSVMTIGETFLEIVSPKHDNTTASRFLKQRQGDGGYMILAQVPDIFPVRIRIDRLGIRKVWEANREEVTAFHVHPKDIGAAIVSFDEMRPAEEWIWAGPKWRERRARYVSTISGTTIQSRDPEAIGHRWSEAFGKPIQWDGDRFQLVLDEGLIEFVEATDSRGDGVSAVQFETEDLKALKSVAVSMNLDWQDNEVELCGTRLQFRAR